MEATATKIRIDFEISEKKSENLFGKPKFKGHKALVKPEFPLMGNRNDTIKYKARGHSIVDIRKMLLDKYNLGITIDISEYEAGFKDSLKAGDRIAQLTSTLPLVRKGNRCWKRASAEEALEIVVLIMLQVEEEKANYLLEPYFEGSIMACSLNTESDELITLEIDKKNKIITLNQTKEDEIITRARKEEKNISSIWLLEIDEKEF